MQHKLLGRTGSRGLAGPGHDVVRRRRRRPDRRGVVGRARDAGVNFIDTADVYNHGRSEEIVGRLARRARDEIVLATKAYFPTGGDPNTRGTSRYHLVRAVEASLRRLATDRHRRLLLHRWEPTSALDETLRAVDDLVSAGKILYPAGSNFAAWQVAHALGVCDRARAGPAGRDPAHVQPGQAPGRGRDPADGAGARGRGRDLQPARRRPAQRQVRGRGPARGHAVRVEQDVPDPLRRPGVLDRGPRSWRESARPATRADPRGGVGAVAPGRDLS